MNLNELENLYREIEANLGEEDPQPLLELLGEQVEKKVDGYCFVIGKLLAREAWAKEEANRLQEIGRVAKSEANRLRGHLLWFLEQRGTEKIATDRYRVSVAGNGGKAPLIIDDGISPEDAPQEFQKVKVEWDVEAVRQAAELGAIPWARVGERGKSLRIK